MYISNIPRGKGINDVRERFNTAEGHQVFGTPSVLVGCGEGRHRG
jgi:hypothetical protein